MRQLLLQLVAGPSTKCLDYSNNPMIKWDGISTLNNFQFHPSGVQVWKAYKIGPGKLFPWRDIQCGSSSSCPLEVLESPVQTQRSCFRVVRARQDQTSTGSKGFSSSCQHSESSEDGAVMAQERGIFSCPEESCIKTFQRSSALQAHLDEGRHKHALEKETLLDTQDEIETLMFPKGILMMQ